MSGLVASLEIASLDELRVEWGRRYGAPPPLRSVDLLRKILAWRIQATSEGGFDKATKRLLRGEATSRQVRLTPGSVITREWKGERHEIEATGDGLLYRGKHWTSLSEIARDITGTRWNGPRFFGLREAV